MPATAALAGERAALREWLLGRALPLWLTYGVDRDRGGFYEALDLHTYRCAAPFRRLRVVARQIVVFSRAHQAGVAGAANAVRLGLDFLARHAAQTDGGYAWRFDLNHRPIDLTRDLYDHAFVLLALASASAVVGADATRAPARALLDWLDAAFTHPQGGYVESLPPALPRRQNPHMHLLEALLAAFEAFGDDIFRARAAMLVDLFATRLFDPACGALPEFFDESLGVAKHDGAYLVEPGHHCEWVWLLHLAERLGARGGLGDVSGRLLEFVDRYGTDATQGGIFDEVASDGTVLSRGARLWPQTERLRAEHLAAGRTDAQRLSAVRGLAVYLLPDGLWHERRRPDGTLSDEPAPASSLYHLTGAILAL